jgi:hypothetical protein
MNPPNDARRRSAHSVSEYARDVAGDLAQAVKIAVQMILSDLMQGGGEQKRVENILAPAKRGQCDT